MKKIFLLLFGLLLSINVYALDSHGDYSQYDYVIENIDFKVDVKNDYTYYVTEKVDVNFLKQTDYFSFSLPREEITVFDRITDIKVNEPFEFDKYFNELDIGNDKEYYEGLYNFEISYVYHGHHINFEKENFSLSLFSCYYSALKKAHFVVNMPGSIDKDSIFIFEEENFDYVVEGNSIIIDLKGEVADASGSITVYDSSDLFVNKGFYKYISIICDTFIIILFCVFLFLIVFNYKRLIRYFKLYRGKTIFNLDSNPIYSCYLDINNFKKSDLVGNLIYLDRIDCINFDLDNYSKDKDFKLNKGVFLSTDYVSDKLYNDLFKESNKLNKNQLSSKLDTFYKGINKIIKGEISLIESKLKYRVIVFIISVVLFIMVLSGSYYFIDATTYNYFDSSSFISIIIMFIIVFMMNFVFEFICYKKAEKENKFNYDLDNIQIDDDSKKKLISFICCNEKLIIKLEKNKEKSFKDKVKFYEDLINYFDK